MVSLTPLILLVILAVTITSEARSRPKRSEKLLQKLGADKFYEKLAKRGLGKEAKKLIAQHSSKSGGSKNSKGNPERQSGGKSTQKSNGKGGKKSGSDTKGNSKVSLLNNQKPQGKPENNQRAQGKSQNNQKAQGNSQSNQKPQVNFQNNQKPQGNSKNNQKLQGKSQQNRKQQRQSKKNNKKGNRKGPISKKRSPPKVVPPKAGQLLTASRPGPSFGNKFLIKPSSVVATHLGSVQGWIGTSRKGRTYEAWTKIPYAQPPVGKLRFQPPQFLKPWKDVLKATSQTPGCMQPTAPQPHLRTDVSSVSEDCLYLDVYRPKMEEEAEKLPVLVYVHGRAFAAGNVGNWHSADYLMDEDVILVQVNYRLNGFGFMGLGDNVFSGNLGLKDLVQALKWVNQNINAFGGNKQSVTVFGDSTGGACVQYLLKSPASDYLVSRGVSHSGSINHISTMVPVDVVKANTLSIAKKFGCKTHSSHEVLQCLQKVDALRLSDAIWSLSNDPLQQPFVPIIEDKTVKRAFATEDLSLRSSTKPWINTFTNGEYHVYLDLLSSKSDYLEKAYTDVLQYVTNWLEKYAQDKEQIEEQANVLKDYYFPESTTRDRFFVQLAKFHADSSLVYSALFNTLNHAGTKWLAQLEYNPSKITPSPTIYVASHAAQRDFYFNQEVNENTQPDNFPEVSQKIIKYLVNFATRGVPTTAESSVSWSPFSSNEILRISGNTDLLDVEYFEGLQGLHDMWSTAIGWA